MWHEQRPLYFTGFISHEALIRAPVLRKTSECYEFEGGGRRIKVKLKKTAAVSFCLGRNVRANVLLVENIRLKQLARNHLSGFRSEASIIFDRRLIALLNHQRCLDLARRFR